MKETLEWIDIMDIDLTHVGITVSDLDASVKFYEEVFGFTCRDRHTFDEEFISAVPNLYKLSNTIADAAFIVASNGIVLELFQFKPALPEDGRFAWNRTGHTHIAFTLDDLPEFAKHMRAKNVRFCMDVLEKQDGSHWVFVQDPDGNLIEVSEPWR